MPTLEELYAQDAQGLLPPHQKAALERLRARNIIAPPQETIKPLSRADTALGAPTAEISSQPAPTQEEPPQGKSLIQKAGTFAAEAGPEILGGIAGGLVAGLPSVGIGAIPGVAIGAAGGRALKEGTEEVLEPLGLREPKSTKERVKDVALSGALAGVGEGAGRLFFGAGSRLFSPGGRDIIPGARAAAERTVPFTRQRDRGLLARALGQYGKRTAFTPGQLAESDLIDTIEGASRRAIFGRRGFRLKDIEATHVLKRMTDDFVDKFGTEASEEQVARLFIKTVQRNDDVYFSAARKLYGQVDDLLGVPGPTGEMVSPEIVPTQSLKAFAKDVIGRRGQGLKVAASKTGDQLLDEMIALPDTISFANAQHIRSQLIKLDAPATESNREVVKGLSRKLGGLLDGEMESAARTLSPEAAEAWRGANAFWKKGKETFRGKLIQSMLKKEDTAEAIIGAVFKPGATSTIRAAREASRPLTWKQMQKAYLTDIINDSSADGVLVASKVSARLTKMGDPALKEIFPGGNTAGLHAIRDLEEVARLLQKKDTNLSAGMMIQLLQAGSIAQLGEAALTGTTRKLTGVSLGILGLPALMSKIFTNPVASRWLINGFHMPRTAEGIKAMTALSGRILARVAADELQEDKSLDTESMFPPPLKEAP